MEILKWMNILFKINIKIVTHKRSTNISLSEGDRKKTFNI